MFDRLLVPVDLTDRNGRAISAARDIVAERGGEVTLLHVIETLDLPYEELEEFYKRLEDRAATAMEAMTEPLRAAGIPVDQEICYGRRAEEIVRYAADHGVDLIVLNSHRVDLENPGAGWTTTSYKVAILSQCPVLLVKGKGEGPS